MVQQWIDASAGLAYISVGGQLDAFDEFLDAIEKLISHPEWRAGMPMVEDIRQCLWIPPAAAVEAWRSYVARHQALLEGCRWAVVTRGDSSVVSILDAAAHDAAPVGVVLAVHQHGRRALMGEAARLSSLPHHCHPHGRRRHGPPDQAGRC
jgi:hypothetical protein